MYKFPQIIGAVLEGINLSDASYIDASKGSEVLNIQGQSLTFDKGWLVIENPYFVNGATELSELIGSKIVDAFSNDEEIRLTFENGVDVLVSLKEEDFIGPEAASYSPKQGEIIVFN